MLCFSGFQKIHARGVEKKEAALSGCHGIRALSLFFSLLCEIAWALHVALALTWSTSGLLSHDTPAMGWEGSRCASLFCSIDPPS
jgi:hypothetical protein